MPQSQTRRATSDPELLELFRQVEELRGQVAELEAERNELEAELGRERARTATMTSLHDDALVRAERALADRRRVLGSVVHDLRTPIGAARMRITLLLEGKNSHALGPETKRHAEAIRRCLDRATRLVTDLLDVNALEGGRFGIERRPVPVRSLVEDAVEIVRPLALDAGVTLDAELTGPDAVLSCDRDRLMQVLGNLIDNALKFTNVGGAIVVRARVQPEQVVFSVEDTGCGIAPDALGRVFEPYWRGEGELRGLGLGLCIAKGLVEAHGGRIDIESVVGRGTRVEIVVAR